MRIALDVTPAMTGATGIARYVTAMDRAWRARDDVDVAAFAVGRHVHPVPEGARHLRVPLRVVARSWGRGGFPSVERLVGAIDTVHASGPVVPTASAPIVAVVYDLAPLDHPDLHPQRDVDQLRRYVDDLRRVAAVVTISQATADALAGRGVPAGVVHVIPIGTAELPPPVRPAWDRPYVLTVGAPVPRKAYADVLRALTLLPGTDLTVVVVGPTGSEDPALEALAAELGLGDRYHRVGPVDDAELSGWYAGAAAVAAPSVDEGFGIPILEAQQSGTPVVVSDIAAHREVAGDAATFVPVGCPTDLAEALAEVLERGPEVERAVQRGRENAGRFSWEACAAATLAVHLDLRP